MDLQLSGTGSGPASTGWGGASDMGPSRSQRIAKVPGTPVLGTFTRGTPSTEANEDLMSEVWVHTARWPCSGGVSGGAEEADSDLPG